MENYKKSPREIAQTFLKGLSLSTSPFLVQGGGFLSVSPMEGVEGESRVEEEG